MILMAMMVYGIVQVDLESIPMILMVTMVYGIVQVCLGSIPMILMAMMVYGIVQVYLESIPMILMGLQTGEAYSSIGLTKLAYSVSIFLLVNPVKHLLMSLTSCWGVL